MSREVGAILGLSGPAGRAVLIVYALGTGLVAFMTLGGLRQPVLGLITLGLFWAAIAVLCVITADTLPQSATMVVLLVAILGAALSSANVLDPSDPGYATWPLGAMGFLFIVLALRGRRGLAWAGFAAVAILMVGVAIVLDREPVRVVNDVARQAAILLIATLFAIALRRATETIAAANAARSSRAAVAAAVDAASTERAVESATFATSTRPALELLATAGPFDADQVRYFSQLAAYVRGAGAAPAIAGTGDALRDARARGVEVFLVDDRGTPLGAHEVAAIERVLVPTLAGMASGSVTMRLAPQPSVEIATLVVQDHDGYRRVVVDAAT